MITSVLASAVTHHLAVVPSMLIIKMTGCYVLSLLVKVVSPLSGAGRRIFLSALSSRQGWMLVDRLPVVCAAIINQPLEFAVVVPVYLRHPMMFLALIPPIPTVPVLRTHHHFKVTILFH